MNAGLIAAINAFLALQLSAAGEALGQPYTFITENADAKELKLLRELYDFDEYVLQSKYEYGQTILLKDWVYRTLPYGFKSSVPSLRNSLTIMKLAKKGQTKFMCSSFAALYMQCAQSLGRTARYIFLRRPSGQQHAAVDIWSSQYRKWIYIDPTWNLHVEENGLPLSLPEIRNRWLDKNTTSMTFVFSAGKSEHRFTVKDFPYVRSDSELWAKIPVDFNWLAYTFEPAVLGRNNFFTCSESQIWSPMYILKDKYNADDRRWPFKNKTPLPENVLFGELKNN